MSELFKPSHAAVLAALVGASLVSEHALSDASNAAAAEKREMPMNEPMPTKMAKPGMKTGDVKKSAERKRERMKPMLEKEQKSMTRK
jgi:hypothetical protein